MVQGMTGVDDILHDQHILALQRLIQILHDLHNAGAGGAAAVAGHGHEVQGNVVVLQTLCQLTHEHGAALQDTDEMNGLSFIVSGNLCCHFLDFFYYLLLRNEDSYMLAHAFFLLFILLISRWVLRISCFPRMSPLMR